LLKRLLLALLTLSLARIVFWIFNRQQFEWPGLETAASVLFWGGYFDIISLFYCLSPFILIHLIPGNWFFNFKVQKAIKIFYSTILFLLFTLTCIDAGYFPFSKSRLGIELFKMASTEEVSIFTYILDYWWFIPVILATIYTVWKLYPENLSKPRFRWYLQIPVNLLLLALLVLTIRGGLRLKPLRSIDTALFVQPAYAGLAISTGFNFLESFQVETIDVPNYFTQSQLDALMLKDYHLIDNSNTQTKKNIVLLILESFGKEYSFPETPEAISYTPFLQQLAEKSTLYNRSYSNGTRSVDAIPAILEGIPKLTKTDFMYSNYIKNTTAGFPYYLNKEGYSCHFYHGGKNGTLGFEAFLKSRGWNYYGMNEYTGHEDDFDGQWGVYDGPYLNSVAVSLSKLPSPFVASVFTLSSHHPYTLPATYKDSFLGVKKPIHKTIRYTDNCLRQFFNLVKDQPWFNETVFIITGDHSSENFTKRYQSRDGKFEVPILVYEPSKPEKKVVEDIIQHIDILPLALERAGYQGKVFTLGTYFEKPEDKLAFQNEEGSFQIIGQNYSISFDGQKAGKKNILRNEAKESDPDLLVQLKAKIQDYYYRLVHNQLY